MAFFTSILLCYSNSAYRDLFLADFGRIEQLAWSERGSRAE
jgi:hypothetical protein